ncbi:hypothetical protein CONCODRAFT_10916, partial [Conidiobolus coronatus NRRL 28638]
MDYKHVRDNSHPYNYILDAIGLALAIPGMILAALVLRVLMNRKWSHMNIDLKLITLTLIFDIISCLESGLNCFFNMINFQYNLSYTWSCNLAATICLIGFITSINLVGLIALERCLLICYQTKIDEIYYWIMLIIFILINIGSIVISWLSNGFTILPASMYCMFDVKVKAGRITGIITLLLALVSVSMVFIGYIKISLKRAQESKQSQIELGLNPVEVRKTMRSTIIKSMVIIFVSCLNNGPYCILVVISLFEPSFLTPLVDCISAS